MKILISAAYYSPHISGLTNSIKNLAELLAANKYDVTVLTTQHTKSLALQEKKQGVMIHRVPYLLRVSKGFFMPRFIGKAFEEVKNADQIIINLPQFEGFIIALLGRIMGKKVHSIYVCDVTMQGGVLAKAVEYVLRLSNTWCLALSDTVISLTEDFAASSVMLGHKYKNMLIIPPVINVPSINESAQKNLYKRIHEKRKDSMVIGFLGRIASEKGIEYLIDAIPMIKKSLARDVVVVLAGPVQVVGEKAYQRKITQKLEAYSENIIRVGELKDEELGAYYALLDVLVLPSINSTEVFGMVQVEAMLCGTTVVATDLPGVRTVIQQTGMGEIAKRNNSRDLAAKITEVLKYKKSYTKRQKEVQEMYDPKKIYQAYKELLH